MSLPLLSYFIMWKNRGKKKRILLPWSSFCECCWNTVPKPQPPNNFWMRAKNSDFLTRLPAYGATPHSSTLVLYSSDLGANWQRIYGGLRHRKILAQRRADDYCCKFKFRYHQTPILWRDTPAKIFLAILHLQLSQKQLAPKKSGSLNEKVW